MTVADDVLRALRARPAGTTDAELARLLGKNHAQINQACRRLADEGLLVRSGSFGGIINTVTSDEPLVREPDPPASTVHEEWAWEGNVQNRVAEYLAVNGWLAIRTANTAAREHGPDITAQRDGRRLLVEVKGWPSRTYATGKRAGQPKPKEQVSAQAAVWFAQGITALIRLGSKHDALLALALPDMPRYQNLLAESRWALERLDITVYLVTALGTVRVWEWEN
jgi:hypothetical protein